MGGLGRGDPGLQFQYEFNTVLFPIEPGTTDYFVKSSDDEILAPANTTPGVFTINLMGQRSGEPPLYDGQHIYISDPLGKLSATTSYRVIGRAGGVGSQIAVGGTPTDFIDLTVPGTSLIFIYSAFTNTWNVLEASVSSGGGLTPETRVATPAALTPLPVASFQEGAQVFVADLLVPWQLSKAGTETPDGITVVLGSDGIARWLRMAVDVPAWDSVVQWFVSTGINSPAGSDLNPGTALLPLLTQAEVTRRVRYYDWDTANPFDGRTVQLIGDTDPNDSFTPGQPAQGLSVSPNPGSGSQQSMWTVKGTRTVLASGTLTASGLANGGFGNPLPNTTGTVTDATVPDWSIYTGKRIEVFDGLGNRLAGGWIMDKGAAGVGLVDWYSFEGFEFNATGPYEIVDYSLYQNVWHLNGCPNGQYVTQNLHFTNANNQAVNGANWIPQLCKFDFYPETAFQPGIYLEPQGCLFQLAGGQLQIFGGTNHFIGCVFLGALGAEIEVMPLCRSGFLGGTIYNGSLNSNHLGSAFAADGLVSIFIGLLPWSGLGVFNWGAGKDAVTITRTTVLNVFGALYGTGGAGYYCQVGKGGQLQYEQFFVPFLIGVSTVPNQEVQLELTPNQIPGLVGGAAVPVAAPLQTWAQLAGAPFLGNVMSYQTPTPAAIYVVD